MVSRAQSHHRSRQGQAGVGRVLAGILGLEVGAELGPFISRATANGVTLDFATAAAESIRTQHYAFLISEREFDEAFDRIRQRGITYYADPHGQHPGEINHNDGGRGLYFIDPAGHGMEIITRRTAAAASWRYS